MADSNLFRVKWLPDAAHGQCAKTVSVQRRLFSETNVSRADGEKWVILSGLFVGFSRAGRPTGKRNCFCRDRRMKERVPAGTGICREPSESLRVPTEAVHRGNIPRIILSPARFCKSSRLSGSVSGVRRAGSPRKCPSADRRRRPVRFRPIYRRDKGSICPKGRRFPRFRKWPAGAPRTQAEDFTRNGGG